MTKTFDSGDRAVKARVKLDKIFQGSDTLERYIERFMSLVAEIEAESDLSDAEKLHRFKHGLKPDLQFVALLDSRTGKPFEILSDLIEYLTRYDAAVGGVSQERGPRVNAVQAERPAKRGRGQLRTARVLHMRANPPDFAADEYYVPSPPPRRHFAAAAMGPGVFPPGRQPVRQWYPRMDGLPPGRRVDTRAAIPMDRICYICNQPGCESWRHTKPGMSYRDALVRPAPPNRTFMDRTRFDPEARFYDRFALGRGQGRTRRGGGRFGQGRGRPMQ